MRALRQILPALLILALLYGGLLFVERLTTQELTRVSHSPTQETICLMWRPRLLLGDGAVFLILQDARDRITDTAPLVILDSAFNALQQCGDLGFDGQNVTVMNRQTGELCRRLTVREGRLDPAD